MSTIHSSALNFPAIGLGLLNVVALNSLSVLKQHKARERAEDLGLQEGQDWRLQICMDGGGIKRPLWKAPAGAVWTSLRFGLEKLIELSSAEAARPPTCLAQCPSAQYSEGCTRTYAIRY